MAKRQYGAEHQRIRSRLIAAALRDIAAGLIVRCPRCGRPISPADIRGGNVDAGHSTDVAADTRSKADRLEHVSCNRKAGAALANRRAQYRPSRAW